MRHAVYAGSFDPVTNGHLWMIEQGEQLFDKLTVAIGINSDKRYSFSLEKRLTMLRASLAHLPSVDVVDFENQFLVNYAKSIGADYIIRGIRSASDYEFERTMRYVNSDLFPEIQTVFLMPPREIAEVSSTMVKGLVGPLGWQSILPKYVPEAVFNCFLQREKHF